MTTRVGFFLTPTKGWMGGINYFKNLFLAIAAADAGELELHLIVPADVDADVLALMLPPGSRVVVTRTRLLQTRHPLWFAWRATRKLLGTELFVRPLVRRYGLDVVSHSDFVRGSGAPVVNWLPDFQHLHLPHMFGPAELQSRTSRYADLARQADLLVVSSEDARKDFAACLPNEAHKARVLRFVSSVPPKYWQLDENDHASLLDRYRLQPGFFYVPNQFWQHKNHTILLDALALAKERGLAVQIVCSGATLDPRSPDHFESLRRRADDIGCGDALRILGIVPYDDVFGLIRFSCAVINPSRSEGWSSTVEECKSVGKKMLLSNLAVHREQSPRADFFDPDQPAQLVDLLQRAQRDAPVAAPDAEQLLAANRQRFAEYGARYLEIVAEAAAK